MPGEPGLTMLMTKTISPSFVLRGVAAVPLFLIAGEAVESAVDELPVTDGLGVGWESAIGRTVKRITYRRDLNRLDKLICAVCLQRFAWFDCAHLPPPRAP